MRRRASAVLMLVAPTVSVLTMPVHVLPVMNMIATVGAAAPTAVAIKIEAARLTRKPEHVATTTNVRWIPLQ